MKTKERRTKHRSGEIDLGVRGTHDIHTLILGQAVTGLSAFE